MICSAIPEALSAQDRVLVFTKTADFRHSSIPNGITAVRQLGQEHGFEVVDTEDASLFNDEMLGQYRAVIFLNTTGDVLSTAQEDAFERYIGNGGGFVGIHSAADTEYDWPFYGELVGAYFRSHPPVQLGEVRVADKAHPSTQILPSRWSRQDEWYNFRVNPRGQVHVLATLAEETYSGGDMGHDHPIAWCHSFAGGRSWYTAGGHTNETFEEVFFREHMLGGIEYAMGRREGDCSATIDDSWTKTVLVADVNDPMELEVAPDSRVFFIERRTGAIRFYDPSSGEASTAGTLSVYSGQEDGLLGIALDPDFAQNQWIYLFYSPSGNVAMQRVSRFFLQGNQLDMASERILLEIPVQRAQCCHSAGSLAFGPDGTLFISTGDNTNPFDSGGFAPIDERTGRSAWDAQKSSGNTMDLRGKILRIRPEADGTYSIPAGNLFPADGSGGRPEIYVMGNRNPFRIAVDPQNGWLYWGEVGPDAGGANPARGPAGHDEWNQARSAGNFGWPYCIADNKPYVDFDFITESSGETFDCSAPINDSPNNTGPRELPPAEAAWIWYPYGNSEEFPELGAGSRTAMGGPVYYYDPELHSDRKLPAYFDGSVFIYEWSRSWIREVKLDDEGDVLVINPFASSIQLRRPMDMELGPDASLYLIEWGAGFNGGNADAQLIRLDYKEAEVSVGTDEPGWITGINASHPYPNPASDQAEIVYVLDRELHVNVDVFDVMGRRIARLVNSVQAGGSHRVEFDTRGLASGMYLFRIATPLGSHSGRFVVVR